MNIISTQFFEEADYNIAYKHKHGDSYLIFLHGLSGSKEYFDEAFHHTISNYMGIVAIDIPGFGESTVLDDDFTLEIQAERISRLIKNLKISNAVLIGHSYAGPICFLLHKLLPCVIKGIILGESSFRPINSWTTNIASKSIEEYALEFQDTCKNGYKFYEKGLVDKSKDNVLLLSNALKKTTAEAMYYSSKSLLDYCYSVDLIDEFTSLSIPVAYIQGSKNEAKLYTDPILKRLQENKMKIIILENSGHCMMLDNPKMFYESIQTFVQDNDL